MQAKSLPAEAIPGSVEELDEKAVEGRGIQLPLSRLLIMEAVTIQECGVQKLQNAMLTRRMHALLGSICNSGHQM